MARLLALIVALVTAVAGNGLLFAGGYYLQAIGAGVSARPPLFVVPFAIVGVLLIGVAAFTATWSSLGTTVVGILALAIGAFFTFVPVVAAGRSVGGPRVGVERILASAGGIGTMTSIWASSGALLLEGALLLVLGLSARRRRRAEVAHPGIARVVTLVVTLLALSPATVLALNGGFRNQQAILTRFAGPDPLGIVMLLVGLAILVVLAVGTRWSGLGAIVWGAILAFAGLAAAVLPAVLGSGYRGNVLAPVARTLPVDVAQSALSAVSIGSVAVVGILFFAGGVASALSGRGVRHRATWVDAAPTDADRPPVVYTPTAR